jgi:hypothetical protein
MGLESRALDVVATVLGNAKQAAFEYGTMFVTCTDTEATSIETALKSTFLCDILLSPMGKTGEFAIDFA